MDLSLRFASLAALDFDWHNCPTLVSIGAIKVGLGSPPLPHNCSTTDTQLLRQSVCQRYEGRTLATALRYVARKFTIVELTMVPPRAQVPHASSLCLVSDLLGKWACA